MEREEVAAELVHVAVAGFKAAEAADGRSTSEYIFALGQVCAVKKLSVALGISLSVYLEPRYAWAWHNFDSEMKGKLK